MLKVGIKVSGEMRDARREIEDSCPTSMAAEPQLQRPMPVKRGPETPRMRPCEAQPTSNTHFHLRPPQPGTHPLPPMT
ncbi:hypothetical protein GE21DRAFT_1292244 [Neurospora crassa]|nr:hypothetical protein GE21DRAFT_1292244 [Neurospora crassa]